MFKVSSKDTRMTPVLLLTLSEYLPAGKLHCVKYARIWFFLTSIFLFKDKIVNSVFIRENTG